MLTFAKNYTPRNSPRLPYPVISKLFKNSLNISINLDFDSKKLPHTLESQPPRLFGSTISVSSYKNRITATHPEFNT